VKVLLAILVLPPASSAKGAAWQVDWDNTLAAAKKEGKVVVVGPAVASHREAILGFQQTFPDLRLEYVGMTPAERNPRISRERQSGLYTFDVIVSGTGPTIFTDEIPGGWYEPLKAGLILPEVLDDKKWQGGFDAGFMDKGKKYAYAFTLNLFASLYVNQDFVPEAELQKTEDLLHPRWKGKIAWNDPRTRGPGSFIFAHLRAIMGDSSLRTLIVDQESVITQDGRQLAEWVVRGRYPIGIGVDPSNLATFRKEGLGLNVKPFALPVEVVTPSFGGVQLMNRAPHPNAAKVFLNWLLGQPAQHLWAKLGAVNSRRLDVPPGDPATAPDPKRLDKYRNLSSEDQLGVRVEALKFAKTLLP
jgi:iron(III) transport system substrate-binding protein